MLSMWRFAALTLVCCGAASPTTASAGLFWDWGYPGYANTSYYAPGGHWAAYGPSYYGPSAGCCGAGSCGSCQAGYGAGCGCDPCGCNLCGDCNSCGSCGLGGCASGNCAGGNCGLNAAPADMAPRPEDPNSLPRNPETPAPRTDDRPPPRRTFGTEADPSDAPAYEPPARNPMTDPMLDSGNDGFVPAVPRNSTGGSGATGGTTRPPFGSGGTRTNEPAPVDESFPPRTTPRRSPAPTSDPLDGALDPATNPADGFSAGKPELPAESGKETTIKAPADAVDVKEPESSESKLEDGPKLDLKSTTAPVTPKTRLAIQPRGRTVAAQRRPMAPQEWSTAPSPLGVVQR